MKLCTRVSPAALAPLVFLLSSAASAQSQVTIYGRLDPSIARNIGATPVVMQNGTSNRFGFAGTEDLGGGLSAFFKLEPGLNIDSGTVTNPTHFFRHSFVGLKGKFGRVLFGRDFTPGYLDAMVAADPWGNATVAQFSAVVTGGISPNRYNDQVNYQWASNGFTASAAIGIDRNQGATSVAPFPHRPLSLSSTYDGGKLKLAYGYDNPGNNNDYWHAAMVSYPLGGVTLRGFLGTGKTVTKSERDSVFVNATIPATSTSQVLVGYGRLKDSVAGTLQSRAAVGYYYSLSKRTTLYADVAHDSKAKTSKTGYDIGVRHFF